MLNIIIMEAKEEYFEYLCLYSNDTEEIKKFCLDYNIDVNDVDILKTVCLRNNDELFDLFIYKLGADFTINNYEILKHYSFIGDIPKLKKLFDICNVTHDDFIKSCKRSTLYNSKRSEEFFFNELNEEIFFSD